MACCFHGTLWSVDSQNVSHHFSLVIGDRLKNMVQVRKWKVCKLFCFSVNSAVDVAKVRDIGSERNFLFFSCTWKFYRDGVLTGWFFIMKRRQGKQFRLFYFHVCSLRLPILIVYSDNNHIHRVYMSTSVSLAIHSHNYTVRCVWMCIHEKVSHWTSQIDHSRLYSIFIWRLPTVSTLLLMWSQYVALKIHLPWRSLHARSPRVSIQTAFRLAGYIYLYVHIRPINGTENICGTGKRESTLRWRCLVRTEFSVSLPWMTWNWEKIIFL